MVKSIRNTQSTNRKKTAKTSRGASGLVARISRMSKMSKLIAVFVVFGAIGGLSILTTQATTTASSTAVHGSVVSDNPADFTPNVNQGVVYKIHKRAHLMFAGGNFTTVTHNGQTVNRSNFVTFNETTGAIHGFAPKFDGHVWAMTHTSDSLYVGGAFTTVNGVPMRGIAKFNMATGKLDTNFKSPLPWGRVTDVAVTKGRLMVGGSFPGGLLGLDLKTGANTKYINLTLSGSVDSNDGVKVYRFAVNPQGNRLVAIGNFTKVNHHTRHLAFMVNLEDTHTAMNPWYYKPLEDKCKIAIAQLRGVDFSPDGSYFVIGASGSVAADPSRLGYALCDVAARFNTNVTSPTKPVWVAHTGGDTIHSVAISGAAVYLQGHFRWLDNPQGRDNPGPGAVSRPGIGAVHPSTGKALPWNPTRQRGEGGRSMLLTDTGLWIANDTDIVANEYRKRVAFFPLATQKRKPATDTTN